MVSRDGLEKKTCLGYFLGQQDPYCVSKAQTIDNS